MFTCLICLHDQMWSWFIRGPFSIEYFFINICLIEKWYGISAEIIVKTLGTSFSTGKFYRETFYNTHGKICDILSIKKWLVIDDLNTFMRKISRTKGRGNNRTKCGDNWWGCSKMATVREWGNSQDKQWCFRGI